MDRRSFLKMLALMVASGTISTQRAYAVEQGDPLVFSPAVARDFASAFAEAMCPELDLSPDDPIALFDLGGRMIGAHVGLKLNGQSHGYVVLDSSSPNFISRFSLGEGAPDLYSQTVSESPVRVQSISSSEPQMVMINPFEYGAVQDDGTLYLNNGEVVEGSGIQAYSTPVSSWKDVMVPLSYPGYVCESRVMGAHISPLFRDTILEKRRKYACAVTALYCIAAALPCPSPASFQFFD